MGFLSINKIGQLCNDMNVDVTFEGDNTVMMQQVARACLEDKALAGAAPAPLQACVAQLGAGPLPLDLLAALLRLREHALTYKVSFRRACASVLSGSGGGGGDSPRAPGQWVMVVCSAAWCAAGGRDGPRGARGVGQPCRGRAAGGGGL